MKQNFLKQFRKIKARDDNEQVNLVVLTVREEERKGRLLAEE